MVSAKHAHAAQVSALLGDMTKLGGTVLRTGSVAYVAQVGLALHRMSLLPPQQCALEEVVPAFVGKRRSCRLGGWLVTNKEGQGDVSRARDMNVLLYDARPECWVS